MLTILTKAAADYFFVLGALTSDRKLDKSGHAAYLQSGEAEVVFMALMKQFATDQLEAIILIRV